MPPFTDSGYLLGYELRMDFMSAFQGFLQKNRDGEPIGIVEIDLRSFDITR